MARIRHFLNTLRTNWSDNPAARGAAKMAAGVVLVAEGLFGVLSNRVRRNNKKGGLFAGIMGVVIGIVFMVVGSFMTPTVPEDEQVTTGSVIEVEEGRNSEGETRFSPVYGYEVDGQPYTLHSSVSSSSRPTVGSEVEIGYSAANPENARRIGGIEGNFHRIFFWAGVFVAVTSLFHVLLSLLLVGFGIYLFSTGRKDRAAAGEESEGFFKDLFSLARNASRSGFDVATTAAGTSGSSEGSPDRALGMLVGATAGGGGQPPPPAGPPPGWYAAPDGSGNQRWWDGTRWTEHTAPPSAPPPPTT